MQDKLKRKYTHFRNVTDLTCVLPVHGVDGGARVHVHEVVVVVARHDPAPANPVVELHAGNSDTHCTGDRVWSVTAPPSYLDNCHTPGGRVSAGRD